MFIFLDESGDLGFDFETKSGCSDYFTIAILICHDHEAMKDVKKAIKHTLKNKINHKRKNNLVQELKGTNTNLTIKRYFLSKMPQAGWEVRSITVPKRAVFAPLKTKTGKKKLYNFLTKELLSSIRLAPECKIVNLVIDRSKDAEDRKDFDTYIRANLENAFPIETQVYMYHESSQANAALQASDLFCYGIQRHYEVDKNDEWYALYKKHIKKQILYLNENGK